MTDPVIVGDQIVAWVRHDHQRCDREPTVDIYGRTPRTVTDDQEAARRAFSGVDDYHRTLQLAAQHECDPACPQYRNPASSYTGPIIQGRRDRYGRPLEPVTPGRAS